MAGSSKQKPFSSETELVKELTNLFNKNELTELELETDKRSKNEPCAEKTLDSNGCVNSTAHPWALQLLDDIEEFFTFDDLHMLSIEWQPRDFA